jgi:CheY-like chemotaxis protein
MHKILLVDDEINSLDHVINHLKNSKEQFQVLTAQNGEQAVEILNKESVDLVITDLRMPVMDGFELLLNMQKNFSAIPTIVMSSFITSEVREKLKPLGIVRLIEKPVHLPARQTSEAIHALENDIIEMLSEVSHGEPLVGLSVSSFLQVLSMDQQTCILYVENKKTKQKGFLYVISGELSDAECGHIPAEEAALEMIAWDEVNLKFKTKSKINRTKKINMGLMSLLMEASRLKDEKGRAQEIGDEEESHKQEETAEEKQLHDKQQIKVSAVQPDVTDIKNMLDKIAGVNEYAIFDENDNLHGHRPESGLAMKIMPSVYFSSAKEIDPLVGTGPLMYIIINRKGGSRYFLFCFKNYYIAVLLKAGVKPADFIKEIRRGHK